MKTPAETASPLPDLTYQNIMTGRRSTHSPMPIHLGSDGVSIYDCSGFLVAKASLKEVAPGIVQACNSFPALYAALEECRDILCALASGDGSVNLAYMLPRQIPDAIQNGYTALRYAGHPHCQEGGSK